MLRPKLEEIPLNKNFIDIPMGPGEWDEELKAAYDAGRTLTEFDDNELPIRAYRKPDAGRQSSEINN
jgi:hypothetical protein